MKRLAMDVAPCGRLWRAVVFAVLFLSLALFASAAVAESRLSDDQEARLRHLARDLRCLVCQNESLADSQAPLAGDLRDEIRDQMRTGATDPQIVQYLVDRYGDFVTYHPPFNVRTLALWLGPFLVLLLLLWAVWSASSRSRRAQAASVSAQEVHEIQETVGRLKQQYGTHDD